MALIEVNNLFFGYEKDKRIINDVSFSINKGEYVSLIGPNGSGKSTLAKLIDYLIEPQKGKIVIDGIEVNSKNVMQIRQKIGIVFQNPDNQFIGSTVEDDIAFGLENRNVDTKKMKELVYKFAKRVGMENFLDKSPSELSGGQKQRVAIAGILALDLKILILDEATSMLDPEGVNEIRELISEIKNENKDLTVISITHNMDEAYESDRIIVLNNGKIVQDGEPNKVFLDENIENIGIELPFIFKVKKELKKECVYIPENIKTLEELSNYICK